MTKHEMGFAIVLCVLGVLSLHAGADDKLVYADFEKVDNGRPVSSRGGLIQLFAYEEDHVHKSTFKGQEGLDPPAPELVHIKPGDPNHAAKFDYSLLYPNQFAGVTLEIHGQPDVDGKLVPDDVTGYKDLSMQMYATGIKFLRVEAVSKESGKDEGMAFPFKNVEVRQGFNTYKIPLSSFSLPSWAYVKVIPKDILKQLTSINLTAFCDQCDRNQSGMVIVDNIVFEK